jgi:hypothetical protein
VLSQAHRRSIHTSLTPVLGEEETDALMSEFPASESDMPATKADLVLLRSDFTLFRSDMQREFANFRSEIEATFRRTIQWMAIAIITAMIGGMGVAAAIGSAVASPP